MFKFSNIWESLLIRYLKYFGSVWERKLKGLSGCFVSRRLDWIPATVLRVLYCVVHPKKNSFCSNDKKKDHKDYHQLFLTFVGALKQEE